MKKRYIEETLSGNELTNWQQKMRDPLKARKISKDEVAKNLVTKKEEMKKTVPEA